MPQITAIKPQEKRKNRFNVYFDGRFGFAISNELLVREGLKVGQELSPQKTEELVAKDRLGRAQEQIYRFLSYRPRSEKEIYDYFSEDPRAWILGVDHFRREHFDSKSSWRI